MAAKRKRHSPEFKARVALEALKGMKTTQELAREYEIHPTQVAQWKSQLRDSADELFRRGQASAQHKDREQELSQAYEQIGRLNMELAWLKKGLPARTGDRRWLIEPNHAQLSVARQCALLELPRSTYYYQPVELRAADRQLMAIIDREYLAAPWYGSRQMTAVLRRRGWRINRKRTQRLMRQMGLRALAPGPHTSRKQPQHPVYPYLLRDYPPAGPDDAWAADIAFVPMPIGFMYLVAVIDWYSRFVLAWELSNTVDTSFCLTALERALDKTGPPGIFNTEQGCQFTSDAFTRRLQAAEIAISMDGRGRAYDTIFIERLWRSLKYECLYLHEFADVPTLLDGLGQYFDYFNHRRPHQGLGDATPAEAYGLAARA